MERGTVRVKCLAQEHNNIFVIIYTVKIIIVEKGKISKLFIKLYWTTKRICQKKVIKNKE